MAETETLVQRLSTAVSRAISEALANQPISVRIMISSSVFFFVEQSTFYRLSWLNSQYDSRASVKTNCFLSLEWFCFLRYSSRLGYTNKSGIYIFFDAILTMLFIWSITPCFSFYSPSPLATWVAKDRFMRARHARIRCGRKSHVNSIRHRFSGETNCFPSFLIETKTPTHFHYCFLFL